MKKKINSRNISVIIPVFNGEETISKCLDSICRQKDFEIGKSFEVIVVDDGSTDNTASIVKKYPVKLITFKKNAGRIVARKTGAEHANFETLLLLDSRIIVPDNILCSYVDMDISTCYAGDLGEDINNNKTPYNRLFFLLRKKYYYPFFPQKEEFIKLTKNNFFKVPKGSNCFFVEKTVFLRSLPKITDKYTNDDTKIFKNILFSLREDIYRCNNLKIEYIQRQGGKKYINWIFERGIRFADFHLFINKKVFCIFLLSILLCLSLLVIAAIKPVYVFHMLGFSLLLYSLAIVYVSETANDFFYIYPYFFNIIVCFWAGMFKGFLIKLNKLLFRI